MLRDIKIKNKLALVMIGLSILVIGIFSALFYLQSESALEERVLQQLSSVKKLKIVQIESVLNSRIEAIKSMSVLSDTTLSDSFDQSLFDQLYIDRDGDFPHLGAYSLPSGDRPIEGEVRIYDISTRHPDDSITLAYLAHNTSHYLLGIVTLHEIQSILMERTGLGQTGESYLVGKDFRMRSISRFYPKRRPGSIEAKTKGAIRAMSGQAGKGIIEDYRGVVVFSAYEKIAIHGLEWAILSEIDYQEALFPLESLRRNFYVTVVIMLAFILLVSYQLARILVKPILRMEQYLNKMSRGVIHESSSESERGDEIGGMFSALNKLTAALQQTIDFAGNIGEGNFNASYQLLGKEDTLGAALLQMKDKLKAYQQNEVRLLKENQQSIINGEEQERSRLSKELHDGLGPLLTSLRLKIQAFPLEETHKKDLLRTLDETIGETRRMSNNLMPSVLEDFGAGEAIKNLVLELNQNTAVQIRYNQDTRETSVIPRNINIILYRVAQEALNNALRHANASEIRLSLTEFDEYVSLFISDNGIGFDRNAVFSGNGLRNMRERVKVVNGSIEIQSGEKGTSIEVEIPLI